MKKLYVVLKKLYYLMKKNNMNFNWILVTNFSWWNSKELTSEEIQEWLTNLSKNIVLLNISDNISCKTWDIISSNSNFSTKNIDNISDYLDI